MKLIHLSDLHLGKRLNGFSMLEDQEYILQQILQIIDQETPDAVIIAGDIYDKAIPPAPAVQLFDRFLCQLSERNLAVFAISGNHDSPERIAFGAQLMEHSGVHLSPVYDGCISPITLQDKFGPVNFYLLPFVKPVQVRRFFPEEEITSYTDALRVAIEQMAVNTTQRNLLVTHQFVTGALRCDSEEVSVGGSDNVDAAVFSLFDYVALGHIHSPQDITSPAIRYCGTPLKYSFSEASHQKSATIVSLGQKGTLTVQTIPLVPLHDLRELRGSYLELTALENYQGTATDDYLHITLTDEEDIHDAIAKLRVIYPNLMKLDYDNRRTRAGFALESDGQIEQKTPLALFCEFYEKQNNQPMCEEQLGFVQKLMETIWEEKE